jgi:hypothetical protein
MCETKTLSKTKVDNLTKAINRLSENLERLLIGQSVSTSPKKEHSEPLSQSQ